jgi:predicted DNA-binding antitoxin AbrB/MazE fold protein
MGLTIEAICENGVLKPFVPLPLKDQEQVRVTIEPAQSLVEQSYGIIGWNGTHESFEQILAETEEPEDMA